jgi:hypothetical protein
MIGFLALNPSRVDISSIEMKPFLGRKYFGFLMRLSFIVLLLLGILLCIDAIVIAVRVTILVVRIILVCVFRRCCFQDIVCLFEPFS